MLRPASHLLNLSARSAYHLFSREDSVGDSEGDRLEQPFLDSLAEIVTRDKGGKPVCCVALQGSGDRHLDGSRKTSLLVARNGAFGIL